MVCMGLIQSVEGLRVKTGFLRKEEILPQDYIQPQLLSEFAAC